MDHDSAPAAGASPPSRTGERRGLGVPLGHLFGVPVRLSPSWVLLAALVTYGYGQLVLVDRPWLPAAVGYGVGFGFVLCLVVSVLLHELGHALTSRRFGTGVRGITLEALGGYTEMEREAPRPSVELAVSMAGPAVSLAVGLACSVAAAVLPAGTLAEELAARLGMANLVVAAFNALPGLPLDGGRALLAVVWSLSGNRGRGQRAAGWVGRAIGGSGLLAAVIWYAYGRLSVLSMVVMVIVAFTIWTGAGQALGAAVTAEQVGGITCAGLTRPIVAVHRGTPLVDAAAQVAASGLPDPVVAVADADGRVVGLVHPAAAAAVPPERRAMVAVDSLTRATDPRRVLAVQLEGLDLLRAVGQDPTADYLVVDGEDVIGVLRGADLTTLLESTGLVSRRTPR